MRNNYADCGAQPGILSDSSQPPATAIVLTLAADPDQFWVLDWIMWSYDADPSGGRITVTYGGVTLFEHDITRGGPGILQFRDAVYNAVANYEAPRNEAMVVTLAAVSGVTGKLTIRYR